MRIVNFKNLLLSISIVFLFSAQLNGQDPTNWRGPEASGVFPDKGLLDSWPEDGPEMKWHVEGLGQGFSSPVFANGKIYLTGVLEDMGYIFLIDMDGEIINKYPYGEEFVESYPGARSSVTVVGDLVYMFSGLGKLVCMEEATGNIKWHKEVFSDYDGRNIRWGITETVLIDGDVLYCTPGGEKNNVVAFNRISGDLLWSSEGMKEKSAYCTPLMVNLPARQLLVTMTEHHIIGLDAKSGKMLWSYPQTNEYMVHANTPVYHDGSIFCFSGYGQGGVMLDLNEDGSKVEKKWFDEIMDSRMGGAVYHDGYLYGSGDYSRVWFCAEWETGDTTYTSKEIAKGVVIMADEKLYCYSQRGELAMVKADPSGFELLGKFKVELGTEQHWAHPVINKGVLYVRHGNVLMSYGL